MFSMHYLLSSISKKGKKTSSSSSQLSRFGMSPFNAALVHILAEWIVTCKCICAAAKGFLFEIHVRMLNWLTPAVVINIFPFFSSDSRRTIQFFPYGGTALMVTVTFACRGNDDDSDKVQNAWAMMKNFHFDEIYLRTIPWPTDAILRTSRDCRRYKIHSSWLHGSSLISFDVPSINLMDEPGEYHLNITELNAMRIENWDRNNAGWREMANGF